MLEKSAMAWRSLDLMDVYKTSKSSNKDSRSRPFSYNMPL